MPISTIGSNSLNQTSDLTINGVTVGKGGGAVATNTAVGASALVANTTGSVNTAIGYNALDANTSGLQNTAVGNMAVSSITTGNNNTGIGHRALESSTGNDNSAVGSAALQSNTTGASNVAMGQAALLFNTTGIENTAVGYQALNSNNTASYNTSVGRNSLVNCTGGYNTVIGHNSGDTITTGTKNTILGRYNGNQGGLDIRTLSNRVVLSDGDGNPRLYADNNGAWQSTSAIGNGTLYPAYFCRAWVFFNCSNAAISGSGNVSSVTRISAGSYRINFTTALPDANYAGVSGFARINATPQFVNFGFDRATTYDRVETFLNGNFDDLSNLSLAYFR